jgi:hypothetical protein
MAQHTTEIEARLDLSRLAADEEIGRAELARIIAKGIAADPILYRLERTADGRTLVMTVTVEHTGRVV